MDSVLCSQAALTRASGSMSLKSTGLLDLRFLSSSSLALTRSVMCGKAASAAVSQARAKKTPMKILAGNQARLAGFTRHATIR